MATIITPSCDSCNSSDYTYPNDDGSHNFQMEVQQSGRTRASTRRANLANEQDGRSTKQNEPQARNEAKSEENRGRKRKKMGNGGNDSDSDPDERQNKVSSLSEPVEVSERLVCSCPKDIMTCIGILPSLPIVSHFNDSSDSEGSCAEDLNHTVLPTVSRNRGENHGDD